MPGVESNIADWQKVTAPRTHMVYLWPAFKCGASDKMFPNMIQKVSFLKNMVAKAQGKLIDSTETEVTYCTS